MQTVEGNVALVKETRLAMYLNHRYEVNMYAHASNLEGHHMGMAWYKGGSLLDLLQ